MESEAIKMMLKARDERIAKLETLLYHVWLGVEDDDWKCLIGDEYADELNATVAQFKVKFQGK